MGSRLLLSIVLLVFVGLAAAVRLPQQGEPGGENLAGLVIRYPDGKVDNRCVGFSEASITGEQLLVRAGLSAIIDPGGGFGGAVCSLNGQGCRFPVEDCFCKCMGTPCEYWAYYHWTGDGWSYSQSGASLSEVKAGALEGWSWGAGNFESGVEPPSVAFGDVCKASAQVYRAGSDSKGVSLAGLLAQYGTYAAIALAVAGMAVFVVLRQRA